MPPVGMGCAQTAMHRSQTPDAGCARQGSLSRSGVQRAKRARNPNRDMAYRRLKRQVVLPVPYSICGGAITHFGHDGDTTRSVIHGDILGL